jgi:hypothetical protein
MGRSVRLVGVPVDIYLRASRHQAELAREFALISFGDKTGMSDLDVPARLLAIVDELRHKYRRASDEIRTRFELAAQNGEARIDLDLPASEATAEITQRLTEILDEADAFCRSGHLLTLEAPPDVVAWRHWWRDQVVGQVRDGAAPAPFPDRSGA